MLLLMALVPDLIAPADPTDMDVVSRLAPPSVDHPLGTDELGRDIFSRLVYGSRVSLLVGIGGVTSAMLVGSLIGIIAGLGSTHMDNIIMRVLDVLLAFPAILLALAVMAGVGVGFKSTIIAIAVVYVPRFSRVARGATLVVDQELYVEAARAIGAPYWRIVRCHVAPNIAAPIIVQFTVYLGFAILVEATLSFLGLGVQPPRPAWGAMLSNGKAFMELSPWVVMGPGFAIMITVLGFNLLGDGLRDILDPQLIEDR
jgi:peptide/nickel transport system permease protein